MTGFARWFPASKMAVERAAREARGRKRRSRCLQSALTPLRFALEQLEDRLLLTNQPDLVVTAFNAPPAAVEGNAAKISISWTVKNEGTAAAAGHWYDSVYLSGSGVIDKSSVEVDSLNEMFQGPLAVGASYTVSRVVTMPESAVGNQSLIVRADDGNAFDDRDATGNTSAQTIDLTAPSVDLNVTAATLGASSIVGGDGQQIDVSWTTKNSGTVAADAGWQDAVYISTRQTLDATAQKLETSDGPTSLPLAAGASYTSHATLAVGDLSAGNYYLIFSANDNHAQGESDQANDTNNTLAEPLIVTSPGNVDLAVSGVTVNGSASRQTAVEGNGQTVSVAYTVTNSGTAAANANWKDTIYLSSKSTLDSSATQLDELSPPASASGLPGLGFAAGESYTKNDSVAIPQWATGIQYLLVETDSADAQAEISKANNIVAVPITLTAPNVDLKVSGAAANVGSAVVGNGQSVVVTYTVTNAGSDTAQGTWRDAIYLSTKQTYDASAEYLGDVFQGDGANDVPTSLAPGASYIVSTRVALPDWNNLGANYLLVVANDNEAATYSQQETDEANDANNLAAVPITLSAPAVNLAISASATTTPGTAPLTVEAGNGQSLNLPWTVTNSGTADAGGTWTDKVVLAGDANDDPTAYNLATVNEPGLQAGGVYTERQTVSVPNMPAGSMDLVFSADSFGDQSETRKSDNLAALPVMVTTPNVDLTISGTSAATAIEGATLPISWTVTNIGSEAAAGDWSDAVYLSDEPTLDDSAVRLTSVASPSDAPLAASSGNYRQTASVTVPAAATGQHYLLFVTNDGQTQGETNYANDIDAMPITLAAPVLAVTSAGVKPSAAGTVVEGGATSVTWSVRNTGAVAAPAIWSDSVFVSDQPYFDRSTTYINQFYEGNQAGLAAGGSYNASEQIVVPQFAIGTAYLLFVPDFDRAYSNAFEHGQPVADAAGSLLNLNDIKAVQVTLAAPDLSVTSASVAGGAGVEGGTVNVSWTVKNASADTAAPASWSDAIYLSSKATFDSSAILLASFYEGSHSGLSAGGSYSDKQSVTLPQFATGSQYLLVVTDYNSSQPQSDHGTSSAPVANDVFAAPITLAAPTLKVTAASVSSTTLTEGGTAGVSWTVQNTSADTPAPAEWIDSVYLSSKPTFDSSAVYLSSFGQVSNGYYSQLSGTLGNLAAGGGYNETGQITLPQFSTGNAYLLVVADYVPYSYSYYGYNYGAPAALQPENGRNGATPTVADVSAIPITLAAPDLKATGATAPATLVEGQKADVSWTVQNVGAASAPATWHDSVYVSRKAVFDSSAVYVGSYSEAGHSGLAAGGGYFDNEQISVPQFDTGSAYLLFVADYGSGNGPYGATAGQPQSDFSLTAPDTNDVYALKVTLAAPDLIVTSASVPSTVVEGQPVAVSWTVKNAAAVPASGAWSDEVYVSAKPTFDASAVSLGTFNEPGSPLAGGASYADKQWISVPQFSVGSAYLLFVSNANGTQPETDGGGTGDTNNVYAVPIILAAPDLATIAATAPANIVAGSQISVSWTVLNLSSAARADQAWYDSVYVSTSKTFDSSAVFVQSFDENAHTGLLPGASYTDTKSITVPQSFTSGTAYLLFVTDYEGGYSYYGTAGQPQSDAPSGGLPGTNDVFAQPVMVQAATAQDPDLQVTAASAPATAVEGDGASIAVSYTVANNSAYDAASTWYDGLYASDQPTWDASDSNQVLITQLNNDNYAGPLAAGQSYTVNQNVTLPALPIADKYLLFVTNVYGGQSESDELAGNYYNHLPDANDVKAVPITLSAPNVDLQITTAALPAAGATLSVGDQIPVSFTVKNAGTDAAAAGWHDYVYYSQSSTFGSNAHELNSFSPPISPLAAGASYTQNQSVQLYSYEVPLGPGYLFFVTDGDQAQSTAANAKSIVAVPITVAAPDLAVTAASGPSSAAAGDTVTVQYTVANQGTVYADGNWQDSVYISDKQTYDASDKNQQFVAALTTKPDELAPGGSYTLSEKVTLPSEPLGQWYLLVVANSNGTQAESDELDNYTYSSHTPDANDVKAVPIAYVAPQVDLAVTAASAPGTAIEAGNGALASVSYVVTNRGTDTATQTWHDKLYLSSSSTFDNTAQFVADLNNPSGTLAAGASYTVTQNVTLPPIGSGPNYLLFVTDADGGQLQSDSTGVGPDANDVRAAAVTTSSPDVNLVTSNPSAATTSLTEGQKVELKFTVTNSGSETAGAAWTDAVYLSTKASFDASAIQLTSIATPGTLAAGATYQFDQTVTIPTTFAGGGYLLFVANDNGTQSETDGTLGDDVASLAVTVAAPGLPDLAVTAASIASGTATAEQADQLAVTYTVANNGAGQAAAPWRDDLYLSDKQTFDASDPNQQYVGALNSTTSALAAGDHYTITANVTLPPTAAGPHYLLVVADGNGAVTESDNSAGPGANNVKAVALNFNAPSVDLQLTSATVNGGSTAPLEAGNGATLAVSYVVTNAGAADTTQTWQDKLYVSSNSTFDASAQLVANLNNPATALAAGASYTVTQNVTLPPLTSGPHYLLFVADADDGQPQSDSTGAEPDANDVKEVQITTTTPAVDLAASDPVLVSVSPAAGQAVEVKFTVTNNGAETASAAWTDAVYISSSPAFSSAATLLGSFPAANTLAAGADYTFDQSVTLPAEDTGTYYLLFVTNDNGAQGESDGVGGDDVVSLPLTVVSPPPPPTPLPDLQITSVALVNDATGTATPSGQVQVTWTVSNDGTADVAANSNWYDSVYLSRTSTYDSSTAVYLGDFSESSGAAGLAIAGTYTDTQSVTIPENTAGGSYYVLVFANQYHYLTESDNGDYSATDTNNIGSTALTMQAADLKMSTATVNGGASATATIGNGISLSLSETVQNASATVTASGYWYDEVFLSTKNTFDSSAVYLATFYGEPNTLAPGSNYTLNTTWTIGASLGQDNTRLAPGSYCLLFVANAAANGNGAPYLGESDNSGGQYSDANNVMALPLTLTAANINLGVSNPTSPATAVVGESFPVSFTVTNSGSDTASASWTNAVYFSYKPTLDNTAVQLTSVSTPSSLAAGGSYMFNQNVTIPGYNYNTYNTVYPGSGYLLLVTNANHAQAESDADNDANNVLAEPISIATSDLAVTSVTPSASNAFLNDQISVSWTVKNVSTSDAPQNGWYDEVFLATQPTQQSGYLAYLGSFYEASGGLAAGGGYSDTQTVTIPNSVRTGDVYLIVEADYDNYTDDPNRLNNYYAVPIHLSVPNADLAVSNVQATPTPSPAALGGTVKVTWTVTNTGTLAANANWIDDVFVSSKSTFDNSATFLGYVNAPPAGSSPLTPNGSYNASATFNLGAYLPTGQVYFFVETNANGAQSVSDTASAVGVSPAVTVSAPDLTVTAATAEGATSNISAALGQTIPVTWTVANNGAVAAPAVWQDAVYISSKPVLDGNAQFIQSFGESSHAGLAIGGNYTDSESIQVPNVGLGQQYLLFVTDSNDGQPESNTANDVFALPITLSAPDLAVTAATAPPTATLGDPISVSWTVANLGSVPALSTWTDSVYVSNVPLLDATATLLRTLDESAHTGLSGASAAPNNQYTETATVTLPSTNIGARYLLFVTNSNGHQGEIDSAHDTNDVFAVPVTVLGADLAVTAPAAPSLAAAGAVVPFTWTVVNQGNATADATWTDAIYFSPNSYLDGNAVLAKSFPAVETLVASQQYTETQQVTVPPSAANARYVLIVTNNNGRQAESDVTANGVDANDVAAMPIQIASVDLAAVSLTAPPSADFGDTIDVSWKVNSINNLPIQADFHDSIYISTKNTFDGTATLLTSLDESSLLPIAQNGSYTQTDQVTIPLTAASANGSEYLYVVLNDGQRIIETNTANNLAGAQISLTLPDLPNLVPTNVTVPATALTGQRFLVSWADQNQGNAPANDAWTDRLWISTKNTLDSSAIYLGDFTSEADLDPGESVTHTQQVYAPGAAGSYYVIVQTDVDNGVAEGPNAADDTAASSATIAVAVTPLADLVVSSVSTPSSGVLSGTTVPVTYTVINQGNAPTQAPVWHDVVLASPLPSLQLSPNSEINAGVFLEQPVFPVFPANVTALGAGQSYSQTVNVTLPFAASGTWYIYVLTDEIYSNLILDKFLDPGPVSESNYVNNLGRSGGFTVSQSPTPDLVTTKVVAPTQAFSGQPETVTWTVANQGAGATNASQWQDDVYLSSSQSLDKSAMLLGTFSHQGVLTPGGGYTDSETVNLPVGVSGSFYFIVRTDALGANFEAGSLANNIQSTSAATTVNLTPPPQLAVSNVTAPATALASHVLNVSYTVTNVGATVTPSEIPPGTVVDPHDAPSPVVWTDTVYLAAGTTLNTAIDLKLGDITHNGALAPNASYTENASFTLPNALSGTFHVIVVTDSANQVFQVDRSQGTRSAANSTVVSSKPAQLVVSAASAPAAANPGQSIPMSWTVTNQGTGDTAVSYWVDKVYATTTSALGPIRTLLATIPHNGLLGAGASYTDSVQVPIPFAFSGAYNLFVYANAPVTTTEDGPAAVVSPPGGWVYELNPSAGISSAIPIAVSPRLAQLQVSNVVVTPPAGGAASGQPIAVSWTISNAGTAGTSSSHWYDDVYLSPSSTFNAKTAIYLGSAYDNNSLAAGANVNESLAATLPASLAPGNYYVIVLADRPIAPPGAAIANIQQTIDLVTEPIEFNQGVSPQVPVALGQTPDLATTVTNAPASAQAGQTITVGWTVKNNGTDTPPIAGNNTWYDEVYLALDNTFEASADIPLGFVPHSGGLSAGGSYNASGAFALPNGVAGSYYILVVADAGGYLFERTPTDRVGASAQAADIALQPPIDLVAGTVTVPASATPGAPFTVTYTVNNSSAIADPGDWTDTLYLSPTTSWQLADPLLGHVHHVGGIAGNGSYSETLTAPLPGVTPGTYYVILRTDALDQVPETDTVNNVDANDFSASSQVSLDVPALTPGTTANPPTPVTGSLTEGAAAYYKLAVAAGQTVQITLTDGDALDVNELYASYGAAPSAGQFDFRGGSALSSNQTITIATTRAGTYYILVKNQAVDGYNASGNPNVTAHFALSATLIDFAVTSVAPAQVGNAGSATLEIEGAKFDRTTTFQLIDSQNNVTQASAIDVANGTTAYVTFDLTGKGAGNYTVEATAADGTTTRLPGALAVVAGQGANLDVATSGRTFVRLDRENVFYISYGNSGDADLPAPLLFVTSPFDNAMSLTADEEYSPYNNLMLVATAQDGPAGILRPGAHYTVPVYWISGDTSDPFGFEVSPLSADDTDPIALSDVEQWVQTSYYTLPNWAAVAAQLMKQVGPTWGDFVKAMDADATLIPSQLGQSNNLTDLMDLEVQKAIAAVGTSISGQLISPDLGIGLGGLNVYALDTTTEQAFYAVTMNDGSFVINQMTAGTYQIVVDGYQLTSNLTVSLTDGQAATGITATIAATPGISGQVLAAANNQPVIGAEVRAFGATGTESVGYTDANGNFDLPGLAPDTYTLEVDANGLARSVVENLAVTKATGPAPQAIRMVAEGVIAGTLALPSGGSTGGTLTVAADLEGGTDLSQRCTAQYPGGTAFSLGGLPAGTYDLTITLDGYLFQSVAGVVVTSGHTTNAGAIAMAPAAVVSGTFTSRDAALPAAGALIGAFDSTGALVDSTTADASGNFTFSDLPAGVFTIEPVGSPDLLTTATVNLVAGANVAGVNISAAPGGTISGTVTDATSGANLAEIPVYVLTPAGAVLAAVSDANGAFSFTHLGLGVYAIYLDQSAGGGSSHQSVTVSKLDGTTVAANLQAVAGATIDGTISATGGAVANASVALYKANQLVASAETDADGNYSFVLVQPGTYDIVVSAPGMSFAALTNIVVAPGATVTENLSAGTATLQVTAVDTQSVAGAMVSLKQTTPDGVIDVASAVIAASGMATFSGLAAGDYTAVVTNANNRGASQNTTLTDGQSSTSSITLAAQGSLAGTITDTSSAGIVGAQIVLTPESDSSTHYYATSGAGGAYSLGNLPLGTYDLLVFASGYAGQSQTAIAINGAGTLNATLQPGTSQITGTLDDWQGNPVDGALVEVRDATGNVLGQAITAADGGYTISGPSGASLTVDVEARGVVYRDSTAFDVGSGDSVSLNMLKLPPLEGQGLGGVIITSPRTPAVAPQAWLAKLPGTFELGAAFKPPVELQPCTDSNGNEPCQSERKDVQDAAEEYLELSASFKSGYEISLQESAELRKEFLEATESFVRTVVAYDQSELQMALTVKFIAGNSPLYSRVAENLNATVSELKTAVEAVENATTHDDLETAFDGLDAARADVIAGAQTLADAFNALGLTQLVPLAEKTALEGFLAAAQTLSTDPYQRLRADIVKDKADDFKLELEAEDGQTEEKLADVVKALAEYYKCLTEHNGDNDGDGDADDKSCIPGPDNDADSHPDPNHKKEPPPFPPQKFHKLLTPIDWPYPIPQFSHGSFDPNDIVGPEGYGDQHFVPANQALGYTIDFENDPSATAPAQEVVITDKLDPNIDPRSFRLGDFGWSGQRFSVPANSAFYQTTIDETARLGIDVQVTATIDVLTGTATWVFQSIDPATGEPPTDPSLGFLPPDDAFGGGEGFVSYSVMPTATVKTGDVIDAQATVIFDTNPPINTKPIFNTIDSGVSLSSQVMLPAAEGSPQFTVNWAPSTAAAGSSGVATYTVYVSDNGGPFTPLVSNTTSTSAVFNGQPGHTYRFYSVASDNAGNQQTQTTTVPTTVGDVVETPLAVPASATEGAGFSGPVATFTGSDPNGTSADFTADIVWGDGSTSTPAAISGTAAGGYTVSGSHAYAEEGKALPLAIIVSDLIGNKTTISNPSDVADAALTATAATGLAGTEGAMLSGTLATFTDADPNGADTDYTATVDWGDHSSLTTIAGSAMTETGGTFSVPGSHVYAEEGTYTITLSIADAGGAKATASPVVTITDATLNAAASPIAATEGAAFSGSVATITDPNPGGTTADFTATVDWGDNSARSTISGAGIIESGGRFSVAGNHAYAEAGTYTLTVTIVDAGGAKATVHPVAFVADAALTATAAAGISGTEGAPASGTLATFIDTDPNGANTDYTATVDWGDRSSWTTITGSQLAEANGVFSVPGNHTYAEEGTYTLTVTIADAGGATATVHPIAEIGDAKLTAGSTQTATATEGITFTGIVGEFTDGNTASPANDFTATITWADGGTATGAISAVAGAPGAFEVSGTHVFSDETAGASFSIVVTDKGGGVLTIGGTAAVLDAPLTATAVAITAAGGSTFSGAVASFTDADPAGTAGDYSATIFWGDGSSSTGAIATAAGGGFSVSGSHLYMQAGQSLPLVVVIADAGGASATATVAVTVSSTPFNPREDVYVIGTGTITVSAGNGLLANDIGPGQLTVVAGTVTGAEGGTFTFNTDGSFTYTPPANFPGFDYAKYTAKDTLGDQGAATVNVLSQTGGVVWKFYEQVLHRDPDYAGLQGWINDFLNGGKPGDIAAGFFESTELLNQIITVYYQQYLGRAPQGDDLDFWGRAWRENGGPEIIKAQFASSQEFNALAETQYGAYPDGWITALYERILGRAPETGALPFWEKQLADGLTEGQVTLQFFTSPEADSDDVTSWFEEYLGRAPSSAELSQYVNQMLAGASDKVIEQAITNLPDYMANPPASAAGSGVRLPDYLAASNTAKPQASLAAADAVFAAFA